MANDGKWTVINPRTVDGAKKESNGKYLRFRCPVCGGKEGHQRRRDACVNLETGFGHCFSGSCNALFVTQDKYDEMERKRSESQAEWRRRNSRKRVYYDQVDISKISTCDYPMAISCYLKQRCISPETAHNAHVGFCIRKSREGKTEGQDTLFMAFLFLEEGEVRNCQYKSLQKEFQFEQGCKVLPWNITAALGAETIIVTEGMMDALALMECGYQNVISVPNGAGTDLSVFDEHMEFELKGVSTILFAGDMDKAGIKLREQFIRKFHQFQVKVVEWIYEGDTLKDGNDMLIKHGKEGVVWCVEHAEEPPMDGILRLSDCEAQLDDYYKNGLPTGVSINLYGIDHLMHFELGRFIPFTGLPGSGKSTFVDNIVMRLCCQYDWRAAVFSPEKWPQARHYNEYISLITGKRAFQGSLRTPSYERAKKYLNDRIIHIESTPRNTIWNILRRARWLVTHYGVRQVVIDPFNYILLEGQKGEIESTIISRVVQQCVDFAHEMNVLVMLVAHPKKLSSDGVQKKLTLADIYGSMAFYNQADIGVVLYSDPIMWNDSNHVMHNSRATWVDVQKMRWKELGQLGRRPVVLCPDNNRFYGCREVGHDPLMYQPLEFDDNDWLANDGEQMELEFLEPEAPVDDLPF
ncbi:MAG: toprim domain-containing protein [Prevotella sp.]|nr:toprim domain-containing protein [Prevotella sp.]